MRLHAAMNEHPILFNGEMVKAILDGTKTQTRRLVRPQPNIAWSRGPVAVINGRWASGGCVSDLQCPYGVPGDHLWVRETWALVPKNGPAGPEDYIAYRADGGSLPERLVWRPSTCMSRWASRLTLEVTDVRARQVQDISENDVRAEGVVPIDHSTEIWWEGYDNRLSGLGDHRAITQHVGPTAPPWMEVLQSWQAPKNPTWLTETSRFQCLWDSIYDKRGLGWSVNPWVWAVSFKRITP